MNRLHAAAYEGHILPFPGNRKGASSSQHALSVNQQTPIIGKTSMQPKVQGERKALVALRRGRNLLVACSKHSFVNSMKAHARHSMRLVLFKFNGSGSFRRNRGHDRRNGNHGRPHGHDGCTLLRKHTAAYPSAALLPPRPHRRKRRQTA